MYLVTDEDETEEIVQIKREIKELDDEMEALEELITEIERELE
jgi:hypothetical protein